MKDKQISVTTLPGMWKIILLLHMNTREYMMSGKRELKIYTRKQGGSREWIGFTLLTVCFPGYQATYDKMTWVKFMEQCPPITVLQGDIKHLKCNKKSKALTII